MTMRYTEWTVRPSSENLPDGVYASHHISCPRLFVVLAGVHFHRPIGTSPLRSVVEQIADAGNLPAYELRVDYRRNRPYRWELR